MSATAQSAVAGPSSQPQNARRKKPSLAKYAHPLPILLPLPNSPFPEFRQPASSSSSTSSVLSTFLSSLTISNRAIQVPQCVGSYDPITRSVWVTDEASKKILFERGFFGKGSLSRSEPTWRTRRMDLIKGGDSAKAEQIREKRRIERKKFKIDRAAAMLDAAKTAEAVLTSTLTPGAGHPSGLAGDEEDPLAAELVDVGGMGPAGAAASPALSATTSINVDVSSLTPQTFLVRPTRPDANRNRGRKAFRRKPPPQPAQPPATGTEQRQAQAAPAAQESVAATTSEARPATRRREGDVEGDEDSDDSDASDLEELVEEMEHLQLSLEETWFLSTALGVLKVYDPRTGTYPPIAGVLSLLLTPLQDGKELATALYPDDPFLLTYATYHHYRSLGWVVKPGIKFCCDWLLYKRGPAFSHAAFSMVLIPVYAAEADKAVSPYAQAEWYKDRLSWKWMNTVIRVNSLVQKTVILVYVTIPALADFPRSAQLPNGGIDPKKVSMRQLLEKFAIREVSMTRFGPARRRD